MPFFTTSAQLRDVAEELFQRISRTPGATDDFARSRMLISVHLSEPDAFIGLNGRTRPVTFSYQPDGATPDLELHLTADTLHDVWMGTRRLRDAFFGGEIRTKGSIFKAMQLAPLFRQAEALYPQLLKEKGLLAN
ncbi:MAG: SCP2 sterol-binding domain-containing protein [Caldilineales bacterium]|nr:SCP2 sterol-binding domain-containing protein [Caldilineales bacterium]MCW5859909.1 SCP2 sterol-binding domain-containing protein [Caldilineales bacterium]